MKKTLNYFACVTGFLVMVVVMSLIFGLSSAKAGLTDFTAVGTSIGFDSTGDVTGACSDVFQELFDLTDVRVRNDADYLYFRWVIAGTEYLTVDCANTSFWAIIDTNNDGIGEYQAEWKDNNDCSIDTSYTALYNPMITIFPPPPIYQFKSSDYVVGENVLELRVPMSQMPLIGETIWVRMGVMPNQLCTDEVATMAYTVSAGVPSEPEVCDDEVDNDLDGAIDCNDSDCDSQEYCSNGQYITKFEARMMDEPTIDLQGLWSAEVFVTYTELDPRGEITKAIDAGGFERIRLKAVPGNVEGRPLFLNDLVEVVASPAGYGVNLFSAQSVKFVSDSPTVDLVGRVLPGEFGDYAVTVDICSSDTDLGVEELAIKPPNYVTGDIYDAGILDDREVDDTAWKLDQLLAGKCIDVHHAEYANQAVRVRPHGFEVIDCPADCGYDCAEMYVQVWDAPTELKRQEEFNPDVRVTNMDFDDLTIELAELSFVGNNTVKVEGQTVAANEHFSLAPVDVLGESFEVGKDVEFGLQKLQAYLRYRDYNGNVCEDVAEASITIMPPESVPVTVEVDPVVIDIDTFTSMDDVIQTIKLRAKLGPNSEDQYLVDKDVSFAIPCELALTSCSGYYTIAQEGITSEDGYYTGWAEAKIRVTSSRIGTHYVQATYDGDNLNYGQSSGKTTLQIKGTAGDGSLPPLECQGEGEQKEDCEEAIGCIFNSGQQCLAEIADLVPYLDKPTAVALAANDICEMASRLDEGDPVGATITGILFSFDVGDNIADAVPVVGNAVGIAADLIEGTIDCVEGIIYDQFKKCGGYYGCFDKVVSGILEKGPRALEHGIDLIGFGSPVDLVVTDSQGFVLSLEDGVFVLDEDDAKLVAVFAPENIEGGYNVEVTGTEDGEYSYKMASIDKDGQLTNQKEEADITITQGEVVEYSSEFVHQGTGLFSLKNILVTGGVLILVIALIFIIGRKVKR